MTEPLHRIGLLILSIDVCHRSLAGETFAERDNQAFRHRHLALSVTLTDAQLEDRFDQLNRSLVPEYLRLEHCRVLELLELRLENPRDPAHDDGIAAAGRNA
jgi:hypothetical protein